MPHSIATWMPWLHFPIGSELEIPSNTLLALPARALSTHVCTAQGESATRPPALRRFGPRPHYPGPAAKPIRRLDVALEAKMISRIRVNFSPPAALQRTTVGVTNPGLEVRQAGAHCGMAARAKEGV